ncbi:MAG: amidohydrolase [Gammaproteobacteria bacterium]|nr:amidohydrolase [Gammaproteobacteria bacterium]
MKILRGYATCVAMLMIAMTASRTHAADVLDATIGTITPVVIDLRHRIHQFPELSNREFKTSALVAEHLRSLGLEVRTGVAHTGVVGIFKGDRPGPVIALRADMDALPVVEESTLPFRSLERSTYNGQDVGVMHACGHDIHTAVLLGVASTLAAQRNSLAGTVVFVFQPAEEGAPEGEEGGAALMLKQGVFGDLKPTAMFALHTTTDFPAGKIGYVAGAAAASADTFNVTINGTSSHAAFPELSVDPVVIGAQAVLGLQTIVARNLSAFEPVVVSTATFHAGVRGNIIPATATFGGTVRVFSPDARDLVERRMREIINGIAQAGGATADIDYRRGTPPLVNDAQLMEESVPVLKQALGSDNVVLTKPVMAAEDFSYFANEIPSVFLFLGVVKPGTTSGPNHSPTFQADDASIPVGIKAITSLVLDRMQR